MIEVEVKIPIESIEEIEGQLIHNGFKYQKTVVETDTYFTIVTSAPGISPISRKCCRNAPSPPTIVSVALFPIGKSFNVIVCFPSPSSINTTIS